jgi:hypothetical protein
MYARAAEFLRTHRSDYIRVDIPLISMDLAASPAMFVILGIWRQALLDVSTAPWHVGVEALGFIRRVAAQLPDAGTCDVSDLAFAVMEQVLRCPEYPEDQPQSPFPDDRVTHRMLLCEGCGRSYWGCRHKRRGARSRSICGPCLAAAPAAPPPTVNATRKRSLRCAECGRRCRQTYCNLRCQRVARNRRQRQRRKADRDAR